MKKNIDQMTAALYTAAKNEYLRNYSDLLASDVCANVTVDQVAALLSGKAVEGVRFADGVELPYKYKKGDLTLRCGVLGSCVRLVDGYTCSVESLPRIYKQLARLAGEKVETIAVGPRPVLAYGFTADALNDKGNKKIIAALKKFCKKSEYEFSGYVFHDPARRCAVWTDAHIMIVSPVLFNLDAAGYMYDKNGHQYPAPVISAGQERPENGEYFRYPNYAAAVPDYLKCYSVDAARIAKNMAAVLPTVRKDRDLPILYAARLDNDIIGVDIRFKTAFDAMPCRVYISHPSRPLVAPLGDDSAGFILVMPALVQDTPAAGVLYEDIEFDNKVSGIVPVADADTLAPVVPPIVDAPAVEEAAPVQDAAPVEEAAPAPVKKQKQFAAWRGAVVEVLEIEDNGDAVIKFKGGALTTTPADNLEPTTAKKTALPDWLTVGAVIDIHSAMNPDQAPSRHTVESIGTTTVYYTDGYKSMINYLMHYGEPVPQAAAASLPLPFLAVCPEVSTAAEPVADAAADVVEAPAEPVADAAADVVEAPAAPLPGWCKDNTTVFNTLYNCKGIIKDFTYNKLFESWQCTFINTATGTEYKKHSISYMEPVEEAPAAVEEAAPVQDAAAVEEAAPAPAPALTDADVLARAARIRAAYDDMTAQAAAEPVADAITAYCAALEEPDAPAPAPVHRHPAILPRLGRWLRAAACLLPVLLAVLMLAASSPAADAPTYHQAAAEPVALVVELPAVTADAPTPAPSPVKKLAAPSPVKNAAADAVTLPGQKTASDIATASAPAADNADSLATAPTVPTPDASPSDGLTICDGTAWAYTMMNWA